MGNIIIAANFHAFVPNGDGTPERKVTFTKGMVVEAANMPEGHTTDDWVAKGLATKSHPLDHDADGRPGGSLPRNSGASRNA